MKDFVAIDFETANGRRSSICSIGAVIVHDGEIVERFYRLVHPCPNYYMPWTTAIHGLTSEDTADADEFPEVWGELHPKIGGLPLVAHNKAFDENCLKAAFKAYGMEYPDYEFHCTLIGSRRTLRLPNHKLPTVAAYCGYDLKEHHHALADAEACATIAMKIL